MKVSLYGRSDIGDERGEKQTSRGGFWLHMWGESGSGGLMTPLPKGEEEEVMV